MSDQKEAIRIEPGYWTFADRYRALMAVKRYNDRARKVIGNKCERIRERLERRPSQ